MKRVGLIKTFSGYEFVTATIESVYDFLDKIVFVHSNRCWIDPGNKRLSEKIRALGRLMNKDGNTVEPVIKKWQKENDLYERKIVHYKCNATTQRRQYNDGYDFIRTNYQPDWIMCLDSDEVWDGENLKIAERAMDNAREYNAIAAFMHTYLKSPFYRVFPPEYCQPTVFIRACNLTLQGIRGNGVLPRLSPKFTNLFFHHFTYVRNKESDIFNKIETSLLGDQDDVPQTELVDMEKWKETKWKNILRCRDLHTTKHYEKSWAQVKRIKLEDLPVTCRKLKIVKEWKDK